MAERLLYCGVPCGAWTPHYRIPGLDREYACPRCGAARILPGTVQRTPARGTHSLRRPMTQEAALSIAAAGR